jgi:TRAP-type C4-dicarboxylate transport system permease large subunit
MALELIILLIILGVFAIGVFVLKIPTGVALALSAIIGALAAGEGIPIRHLVEGTFGFLDPILIIATAMIFMKVIEATGALGTIGYGIIKRFYSQPTLLMIFISFFIMFPGMLTGLSSACIMTTGALVIPALLAMGIPVAAVGSFVVMMAVFGEIAPPINIPVMIIGSGVDMPYIGFELPLMLLTFPLAILTAVVVRYRYLKKINIEDVLAKLPQPVYQKYGFMLYLPILVVIGLMVAVRTIPQIVPDIGIPLIFLIGATLGFGTGEKFNFLDISGKAIKNAMPIMAILVGVGMMVQILTLTGVRGFIALSVLKVPEAFSYIGAAIIMPAFGSAYAASSVLGVPLVYVFLGKNEIFITSALSLLAALGDLMPPASLLCVLSAQFVGEKNHFRILRESIPYIIACLAVGILMLMFASEISTFFNNY